MRTNHRPVVERLENRIAGLQARYEQSRAHRRPNPYWYCRGCGIHDPELSINNGRHFGSCPYAGLPKQIAHFKLLLEAARKGIR